MPNIQTDKDRYIAELKKYPEQGRIIVVRITNTRPIPLRVQVEPLSDERPPLAPGTSYQVVTQAADDNYSLDIDIADDRVSVWFESLSARGGEIFDDNGGALQVV